VAPNPPLERWSQTLFYLWKGGAKPSSTFGKVEPNPLLPLELLYNKKLW